MSQHKNPQPFPSTRNAVLQAAHRKTVALLHHNVCDSVTWVVEEKRPAIYNLRTSGYSSGLKSLARFIFSRFGSVRLGHSSNVARSDWSR